MLLEVNNLGKEFTRTAGLFGKASVVRAVDDVTSVVEAFDPAAMMGLADNEALLPVAADAGQRLRAALASLDPSEGRA